MKESLGKFKPSGKIIDDEKLAEEMAYSSNEARTEISRLNKIINPKGIRERLSSFLNALSNTQARDLVRELNEKAETQEDRIEIEEKIKKAVSFMGDKNVEALMREIDDALKSKDGITDAEKERLQVVKDIIITLKDIPLAAYHQEMAKRGMKLPGRREETMRGEPVGPLEQPYPHPSTTKRPNLDRIERTPDRF